MALLDPSDSDKNPKKKPRFRQDMIAFLVMFLAGVGALVYFLVFD